jgi:hypothetical protein
MDREANHVLRERVTIQLHLIIKFQMPLLDSLLDPHPEDPAIVDGVRASIMKATVMFFFNSIGLKHRMPFRQLDSAFLHQELEELVSFGDIKVIGSLGLLYPSLVHSQGLLAPHNLSGGHFLVIIEIFHLVSLLEELVVDVSYLMVLGKSGVLLEPVGLITHQ